MPDNDLAAALEFVKRRSAFVPTADNSTVVSKDEVAALRTIRDAYLAREADDAKPVTREWLDDRVGGRIENAYLRPHADGQGRCDAIQEIGGEWWAYVACMESAGSAAARRLDTRKQALAFLELADWPTNENGGE